MSMSDPIADMLARIRNASRARKKELSLPSSRIKVEIAKILKDEGYIRNFKVLDDKKQGVLTLVLKYGEDNKNVITGLRRVSKPGCRVYCTRGEIPEVLGGLGLAILSTPRGILPGRKAEEAGVGGEVLCTVW